MMSIAETQLLQDLKRRVEALEAQIAGRPAPAPLAELNASRQTHAQRLREAIASILVADPTAHDLTAKEVGRALERRGFDRLPAERTLRLHLAAVRAATAAHM
ncbi:MAG: hypothetical protein WBE91_11770 [Steroidobacteraceae bacterium]